MSGNWSFEIVKHEIGDNEVIIVGKLIADEIVKMAFGGAEIKRRKESSKIVCLADDLKAAGTDALRKTASLLAAGLHLYGQSATGKEYGKNAPSKAKEKADKLENRSRLTSKQFGARVLVIQGSKQPEIVEHKTTGKKYAAWQWETDTQPTVYAHAAREIGIGEADVRYQLLVKTRTPSLPQCPIQRGEAHIKKMMDTFTKVLRSIEAGHFWRNRSWACADCPFKYKCDCLS